MPFKLLRVKLRGVKKAEIKRIVDYLKDLEQGLYEWDYRGITIQGHLTELYGIIERLMQATFETKDQELKPLLATLEMKARKCKQCIETRTGGKELIWTKKLKQRR